MLHRPFRLVEERLGGCASYVFAYALFLLSGNIPPSLVDDVDRLEQQNQHYDDEDNPPDQAESGQSPPTRTVEEWMMACRRSSDMQPSIDSQQDVDWTLTAQVYTNLEEMPSFITRQQHSATEHVMDLPLYSTVPQTALSDLGSSAYQLFDHVVILNQVMRQSRQNPDQELFRNILMRLRDAQVTEADWLHLMKQTPAHVQDLQSFNTALRLHPTSCYGPQCEQPPWQ